MEFLTRLRAAWNGTYDAALEQYADKMTHTYVEGMGPGSWNEAQQVAGSERQAQRDRAKGKVNLNHSQAPRLRRVG